MGITRPCPCANPGCDRLVRPCVAWCCGECRRACQGYGTAGDDPTDHSDGCWVRHEQHTVTPVLRFLAAHPYLQPLVAEAEAAIWAQSPPPGTLTAPRLMTDPETGEQHLTLFIKFAGTAREAFALLTRVDEEWWLDAMPRARGLFNLNVEFVEEER